MGLTEWVRARRARRCEQDTYCAAIDRLLTIAENERASSVRPADDEAFERLMRAIREEPDDLDLEADLGRKHHWRG